MSFDRIYGCRRYCYAPGRGQQFALPRRRPGAFNLGLWISGWHLATCVLCGNMNSLHMAHHTTHALELSGGFFVEACKCTVITAPRQLPVTSSSSWRTTLFDTEHKTNASTPLSLFPAHRWLRPRLATNLDSFWTLPGQLPRASRTARLLAGQMSYP